MKRFVVLDSFRGICAVAVVLFHTQILLSFSELSFFRHADLFVEFFFVLSGFVMMHAYGKREFGTDVLRRFIISRTFRLYPLHLLMLVVFIGLEFGKLWAEHHGFSFNDAAFTGKTAPSEILPNALLLQSWIGDFNSLSFNTPAWSISIEYYLYMLLGLLLLLMPRYCGPILALATVVSFAALYVELNVIKPFIWRGASCFFAGALTYRLYERVEPSVSRFNDRPFFTGLELLCVLLVYRTLTHETPHQGLVASLLFCAVVLVFACERGAISRLLHKRGFVRLGELSFSIYLTHAAVIFAFTSAAVVISKLTGSEYTLILRQPDSEQIMRYITTGSVLVDDLLTVLELGIVLAVSSLTYHYVELKGIQVGRQLSRSKPLRQAQV